MAMNPLDVLPGTLDMLVLKSLLFGPAHGYGIMRWLRQTADQLNIEDAALYPALHRLEGRELIESEWGLSESNRKARYYRLTPAGRRELKARAAHWNRYVALVAGVMEA